ncbi:hypothetical protein YPPY99_1865, partial [Yersinia pestis PY-99]
MLIDMLILKRFLI